MGAGNTTDRRGRDMEVLEPRRQRILAGGGSGGHGGGVVIRQISAGIVGRSMGLTAEQADALQKINARKRRAMEQEEDFRVLTRNADPHSLRALDLIGQAEAVPANQPAEKLRQLRECYPIFEKVPATRFDQLAMMVYQKEGEVYHAQGDTESAKATYTRAITLAEQRVARGDKDMYMILKRYVLSMVGLARIWYEHERDTKGFRFADHRRMRVPIFNPDDANSAESSISSLENSFSSAGSVFSINQAILKSMAPRLPRSRTGPNFVAVRVKAPHVISEKALGNREDEFVLHSQMTRELVASPCELLLLRCCEVVEIGHNCQSELLIPALIELAQIYEDLRLYSRALLLVRRCLGILCNVYDYDHPWVIELMIRAERLNALLEDQLRNTSATAIQATWKMYKAMRDLEDVLGHPVRRHRWIPRKYRTTPDIDIFGDIVDALPEESELDDGPQGPYLQAPQRPLPRDDDEGDGGTPTPHRRLPHPDDSSEVPEYPSPPQMVNDEEEPSHYDRSSAMPPPPVVYNPLQSETDPTTFTTMAPNAKVVGSTQDTQTDTRMHQTPYGDVLTVRTTTITRTITENLPTGGDDEDHQLPPHCPRCDAALPFPHCPRCRHELPPHCPVYRRYPIPQPDDDDGDGDDHAPDSPASQEDGEVSPGFLPPLCPYCLTEQPLRRCAHCYDTMPGNASAGKAPIPYGEERCPHCAERVPPMQCGHCGREQPPLPALTETEATGVLPEHCPFCYTTDAPEDSAPVVCQSCGYVQPQVPHTPPTEALPMPGNGAPRATAPPPIVAEAVSPQHGPGAAPHHAHPPTPTRAADMPPSCRHCGKPWPRARCTKCARLQPVTGAGLPGVPALCPYCRHAQPIARCPACKRTQEESPEESYLPTEDPPMDAEVPDPLRCQHCGARVPPPRCPGCHRLQPLDMGDGDDDDDEDSDAWNRHGRPRRLTHDNRCLYCATELLPQLCPACHSPARSPRQERPAPQPQPTKEHAPPPQRSHLRPPSPRRPPSHPPQRPHRYHVAGPDEEVEEDSAPRDGVTAADPVVTREYTVQQTLIEHTYYETDSDDSRHRHLATDDDDEGDDDIAEEDEEAVDALIVEIDQLQRRHQDTIDTPSDTNHQYPVSPPVTTANTHSTFPPSENTGEEIVTVTREVQMLKNGRRTITHKTTRRRIQGELIPRSGINNSVAQSHTLVGDSLVHQNGAHLPNISNRSL